jgi:hypothetical protein
MRARHFIYWTPRTPQLLRSCLPASCLSSSVVFDDLAVDSPTQDPKSIIASISQPYILGGGERLGAWGSGKGGGEEVTVLGFDGGLGKRFYTVYMGTTVAFRLQESQISRDHQHLAQ